uniref:Uncharacterized protein n=1 Tax=Nelumbo nucifera TaxID=4432 RepID=A0A822Y015_NELNU|nr:TPA_asm: hypothetical protein HUJ06_026265 [Nelumbo nucifera]
MHTHIAISAPRITHSLFRAKVPQVSNYCFRSSLATSMASSTVRRVLMLLSVVFLILAVVSEARVHRDFLNIQKKEINSHVSLRGLMETPPSKMTTDIGYMRLSPGGPDPQHHSGPPLFF